MKTEVSVKSTKNEILDAYNDLIQSIQDKKTEEPIKRLTANLHHC
jgi:hypothetical protein